jgi:hypothetical protein
MKDYSGLKNKNDFYVDNLIKQNEGEIFMCSKLNNKIDIFDNYITKNLNNSSLTMYNTSLHNSINQSKKYDRNNIYNNNNNCQTNNLDSKLHDQLLRKRRERSSFYNFILLTTFNINDAHFCFPYLLYQVGLINLLIILFISAFYSYIIHSDLVKCISSNREIAKLNFADLIEKHFGSFCSWSLEIGMIIWLMLTIVNFVYCCNFF